MIAKKQGVDKVNEKNRIIDRQVFQINCNNPDCGLVIATSGDPFPIHQRFALQGCPYCSSKEYSTNYDTSLLVGEEVSVSVLSVIIPFFGVDSFAKDCIESVLEQDVSSMDIYLVDDGSRDSCPKICDSYLFDPRVVVIHQKNAGISVARNTALELIHSEYVTFVDGDDKLLNNPKGYSRVIATLRESGADLACFCYVLHAEGEEPSLPEQLSHNGYVFMNRKESLDFFFDRVETIFCSVVWNKIACSSLFKEARFYPGAYCNDLRLMPNLFRKLGSLVSLDEYLVSYLTKRKGSVTGSIRPKLLFDRMMAVRDCLDFAIEIENETYIKIMAPIFAKYLTTAYYGAWKGTSPDPEERKNQKSPEYMRQIISAFNDEKQVLLDKTYLPIAKKRVALRILGLSKYAFLVYNRIFHAFEL